MRTPLGEESLPTVRLQIGAWSRVYYVVATDAPDAYDGFGTFTLHADYPLMATDRRGRLVLVDAVAISWQMQRYESGGYVVDRRPDAEDPRLETDEWVRDLLVARLEGREGAS